MAPTSKAMLLANAGGDDSDSETELVMGETADAREQAENTAEEEYDSTDGASTFLCFICR